MRNYHEKKITHNNRLQRYEKKMTYANFFYKKKIPAVLGDARDASYWVLAIGYGVLGIGYWTPCGLLDASLWVIGDWRWVMGDFFANNFRFICVCQRFILILQKIV